MERSYLEDCLGKGMSLLEIGRKVGRPAGTVGYWVKKHGLVANGSERFRQKGAIDRVVLSRLVDDDLSVDEIAEELGVPPTRVRYWVKEYALGRTRGGRRIDAVRRAREQGLDEVTLDCPVHGRTAYWVGKTRIRCRRCNSAGVARRRRRVKQILVEEAGGKCVICGFDRSLVALEFHHMDPKNKSFALGQAGITRSIAASRAEAAKCVLLCANCHAEVEAGLVQVPVKSPSFSMSES